MVPTMVVEGRTHKARAVSLLVGRRLEYVRLGHAVVLTFGGGSEVLIETAARLSGPGVRAVVEPGDHPSDVLATLLGAVVTDAWTGRAGTLTICFAGGSELAVEAHADVESWAVAQPGGVLVVCLPGGEVAVWGDYEG